MASSITQKCQVCGADHAGFHYNGIVCSICRVFFLRQTNRSSNILCKQSGNCSIRPGAQDNCRTCRYKKCISIGMDPRSVGALKKIREMEAYNSISSPTTSSSSSSSTSSRSFRFRKSHEPPRQLPLLPAASSLSQSFFPQTATSSWTPEPQRNFGPLLPTSSSSLLEHNQMNFPTFSFHQEPISSDFLPQITYYDTSFEDQQLNPTGKILKYTEEMINRESDEGYPSEVLVQKCVARYHSALFAKAPVIVPGDIETIILCHRMSMNELGPSPSTAYMNLNIPLAEVIARPELCSSRSTACLDSIVPSKPVRYDFPRTYCRWMMSFVDFLQSTHYFSDFSIEDKQILMQYNMMDFHFYVLLECQLRNRYRPGNWKDFSQRFGKVGVFNTTFAKVAHTLNVFTSDVLEPLVDELKFDEYEYNAVKVIAVFSAPGNISKNGQMKCNFIRDAYSTNLQNYIADAYPELPRTAQLYRLKRLLDLIPLVKKASQPFFFGLAQIIIANQGELAGALTYDMHVREINCE